MCYTPFSPGSFNCGNLLHRTGIVQFIWVLRHKLGEVERMAEHGNNEIEKEIVATV